MTAAPIETASAECRRLLELALTSGDAVAADLRVLGATPDAVIDDAVRAFANDHGAAALPVLNALSSERSARPLRRAARRALYRLGQRGITAPPAAPRPVVTRQPERPVRAWVSGIDGAGSRAVWIVIEGGYGTLSLCSVIVNDVAGIMEVAGGDISKKRLEHELAALRAEQKLPWIETDPTRAVGLVAEALERHTSLGTSTPAELARWQRLIESTPPPEPLTSAPSTDPALLDRSPELIELPEMAGWFLDPEAVQSDALDLLQARESRLVVSDQIKAEREDAIVARVVEREFHPEARARWARRLLEMGLVFRATSRPEPATLADVAAAALADDGREVRHHPLARALARRGLEVAADVALGRVSASEVSRKPGSPPARPAAAPGS